MHSRQQADEAVARGIKWLNSQIPDWRKRIDVDVLDLKAPCRCVLGQLDGDFYQAMWERRLSRKRGITLGFSAGESFSYRELTAAWRRALKAGDRTE